MKNINLLILLNFFIIDYKYGLINNIDVHEKLSIKNDIVAFNLPL